MFECDPRTVSSVPDVLKKDWTGGCILCQDVDILFTAKSATDLPRVSQLALEPGRTLGLSSLKAYVASFQFL
jgi:hypothetical protein